MGDNSDNNIPIVATAAFADPQLSDADMTVALTGEASSSFPLKRNLLFASDLERLHREAPVMCAADANRQFLTALTHRKVTDQPLDSLLNDCIFYLNFAAECTPLFCGLEELCGQLIGHADNIDAERVAQLEADFYPWVERAVLCSSLESADACAVSRAAHLNDEFVTSLRSYYPALFGSCQRFSVRSFESLSNHCDAYLRLAATIRVDLGTALEDCGFEALCHSYMAAATSASEGMAIEATVTPPMDMGVAGSPTPPASSPAPLPAPPPALPATTSRPAPELPLLARQNSAAALTQLKRQLSSGSPSPPRKPQRASAPAAGSATAAAFAFSLLPSPPLSRQPSRSAEAEEADMCPVCFENPATFRPPCGHATCFSCAVQMVRAALGEREKAFQPGGIACADASPQRCAIRLALDDVQPLLTAHDRTRLSAIRLGEADPGPQFGGGEVDDGAGGGGEGLLGLSYEQYELFSRFMTEAAIPADERVYCPSASCGVAFQRADAAAGGGDAAGQLRCPHCTHSWRPEETAESAANPLIAATSRPCPNCDEPISKYHGHSCHHISPMTDGCPNCHQHFCIVCAAAAIDTHPYAMASSRVPA